MSPEIILLRIHTPRVAHVSVRRVSSYLPGLAKSQRVKGDNSQRSTCILYCLDGQASSFFILSLSGYFAANTDQGSLAVRIQRHGSVIIRTIKGISHPSHSCSAKETAVQFMLSEWGKSASLIRILHDFCTSLSLL